VLSPYTFCRIYRRHLPDNFIILWKIRLSLKVATRLRSSLAASVKALIEQMFDNDHETKAGYNLNSMKVILAGMVAEWEADGWNEDNFSEFKACHQHHTAISTTLTAIANGFQLLLGDERVRMTKGVSGQADSLEDDNTAAAPTAHSEAASNAATLVLPGTTAPLKLISKVFPFANMFTKKFESDDFKQRILTSDLQHRVILDRFEMLKGWASSAIAWYLACEPQQAWDSEYLSHIAKTLQGESRETILTTFMNHLDEVVSSSLANVNSYIVDWAKASNVEGKTENPAEYLFLQLGEKGALTKEDEAKLMEETKSAGAKKIYKAWKTFGRVKERCEILVNLFEGDTTILTAAKNSLSASITKNDPVLFKMRNIVAANTIIQATSS